MKKKFKNNVARLFRSIAHAEYIHAGDHYRELKYLDTYRNGSCTVCSDLSFGGVGSKEGYTTVLARTGLGLELFKDAEEIMWV